MDAFAGLGMEVVVLGRRFEVSTLRGGEPGRVKWMVLGRKLLSH